MWMGAQCDADGRTVHDDGIGTPLPQAAVRSPGVETVPRWRFGALTFQGWNVSAPNGLGETREKDAWSQRRRRG